MGFRNVELEGLKKNLRIGFIFENYNEIRVETIFMLDRENEKIFVF